jgi:hypothetical protein
MLVGYLEPDREIMLKSEVGDTGLNYQSDNRENCYKHGNETSGSLKYS